MKKVTSFKSYAEAAKEEQSLILAGKIKANEVFELTNLNKLEIGVEYQFTTKEISRYDSDKMQQIADNHAKMVKYEGYKIDNKFNMSEKDIELTLMKCRIFVPSELPVYMYHYKFDVTNTKTGVIVKDVIIKSRTLLPNVELSVPCIATLETQFKTFTPKEVLVNNPA
jgi:hypothetical protein